MPPKKDFGRGKKNPKKRIDPGVTPVAERQRLYSECSENTCSLCWNEISIFAVGVCNHAICHVCMTRMRVLCSQKDCAICRQDMPMIVLSRQLCKYDDLANQVLPKDKKYQICFEDGNVKKIFDDLLTHKCLKCPNQVTFTTFKQLDTHTRREHELFFCDLCSANLKVFSHERKLYTRPELATHRRKGDPDDSSHRGHPLCQFCEVRYVDDEELFRHLRRDHFYCHFCDADGVQAYYPSYPLLRDHFKSDHLLCEDGDCLREQFTNAFRSELDLKVHRLNKHSSGLSKSESKINRTVDIDVSFNRPGGNHRGRDRNPSPEPQLSKTDKVPDMSDDFPTLAGGMSSMSVGGAAAINSSMANRLALTSKRNIQSSWASNIGGSLQDQDFPSLPGQAAQSAQQSTAPQYQVLTKQKRHTNQPQNLSQVLTSRPSEATPRNVQKPAPGDFPSLPVSNNPIHAFGVPTSRNGSQNTSWANQAPAKSKPAKGKSVAPAPDLNFPSLEAPSKASINDSNHKVPKKSKQGANNPSSNVSKPKKGGLKSAADLIFSENPPSAAPSNSNSLPPPKTVQEPEIAAKQPPMKKVDTNPINSGKRIETRPAPPGFTQQQRNQVKASGRYMEPSNFQDRNMKLLTTISAAFGGGKSLEFGQFKGFAKQFKENGINADQFMRECKRLADGSPKMIDSFMPEMIALLPNIEKQNQLFNSYIENFSQSSLEAKLESCPKCRQILSKADKLTHRQTHDLDSEFPAL